MTWLDPERTPEQDVEFGMIQISEVAMKELSPSLNDPTTAIGCIKSALGDLTRLGTQKPPEPRRTRDCRILRIASFTVLDDAIKLAFDELLI